MITGLYIQVVSNHYSADNTRVVRRYTRIPVTTASEAERMIALISSSALPNYDAWLVGTVFIKDKRMYLTATELDMAIEELSNAREQYSEYMNPMVNMPSIPSKKNRFPDFEPEDEDRLARLDKEIMDEAD